MELEQQLIGMIVRLSIAHTADIGVTRNATCLNTGLTLKCLLGVVAVDRQTDGRTDGLTDMPSERCVSLQPCNADAR